MQKVYKIWSSEDMIGKKDELIYSLMLCNKNSGRLLYHNYFLDPNKSIKSYKDKQVTYLLILAHHKET